MGTNFLQLGDQYMYWRFMCGGMRTMDDYVHQRIVTAYTSPKSHRAAPTADAEFTTPGDLTVG